MYFDLLEECPLDENNETALPTRHTLSALVRQPEESSKAQTQMQAYRGLAGWNAMRQASIIHMGIFPQGSYGTAKITCFNEKRGRALAQSKAGNQSPSTCHFQGTSFDVLPTRGCNENQCGAQIIWKNIIWNKNRKVRHFGSIMLSLASTTTLSVLFFVLFVPGSTPAERKDEHKWLWKKLKQK